MLKRVSPYRQREGNRRSQKSKQDTSILDGDQVQFLVPLYSGRPLTVLFSNAITDRSIATDGHRLTYKLSEGYTLYSPLRNVLADAGLKPTASFSFHILFSAVPKPDFLLSLKPYQKVNHFPGSWQIGRKDNMWKNIDKFKHKHKKQFNICPKTFILPEHYAQFNQERKKHPQSLWIMKPSGLSCGRGIRVVSNKTQCDNRNGYVVSRYIMNPHLINGYKYDLRIYVCVTCFEPLRIYMYREGLVRFATEPYKADKKKIKRRYMHLTNFSINKRSPNYVNSTDDRASKWALSTYLEYLNSLGVNTDALIWEIEATIVKALIAVEPLVSNKMGGYSKNCFELYGFDILLDSSMKPWLLEVNISPSLSASSNLDKRIKTSLIADLLTLVGVSYTSKKGNYCFRNVGETMKNFEERKLSQEDLEVLVDAHEEWHRAGNFKLIFPLKDNIEYFSRLFQCPKYYNPLLWNFINSSYNLLDSYFQPTS